MIFLLRKIRARLINQKKVWSYLAYALGEILLVVIGIYLAVEFNNFNQNKQNQEITQVNLSLLMEGLKADSAYYERVLANINESQKYLESFYNRLSANDANLDTLIKIARYEFTPAITRSGRVNNNAYNAILQSGEINLIEKGLRLKIFSHYNQQKSLEESDNGHFDAYLESLNTYNAKFGLNRTSPYKNGPIEDAIWEKVNMVELAKAFHPLLNTKANHYGQTKRLLLIMIDSTNDLLTDLNQALND